MAAEATAPVMAASATTSDTDGTTTPVTMPSGISAGHLLLVFACSDSGTLFTQSGGSDWTRLFATANGTAVSMAIFAKVAAGGDALTTAGAAQDAAMVAVRVTGHGVTAPAVDLILGAIATGNNTNPNPPNNISGGPQDYLFIESFAAKDDDETAIYYSTNYTSIAQAESAQSASSCMTSAAYRALSAVSEDPGAMALAVAHEWIGQSVSIPPAITFSTAVSDTFTRSDSTDVGTAWDPGYTARFGGSIVTNRVRVTALSQAVEETYNALTPPNNQWAKVTIPTWTGAASRYATLVLRATSPPTTTYYACEAAKDSAYKAGIYKVINDVTTFLTFDEGLTTWAATDTARCYAVGTRITMQRNDVSILTAVDGSLSGGRYGFGGFIGSAGALTDMELDAYLAGGFQSATLPTGCTFTWNANTEGDLARYYIEANVNTVTLSASSRHDVGIATSATCSSIGIVQDGNYHARLLAADTSGNVSAATSPNVTFTLSSVVGDLTLAPPTLTVISNGGNPSQTLFQWATVTGANGYILNVHETAQPYFACSASLPNYCTTVNGLSQALDLSASTAIDWWVCTLNSLNICGTSNGSSFTTGAIVSLTARTISWSHNGQDANGALEVLASFIVQRATTPNGPWTTLTTQAASLPRIYVDSTPLSPVSYYRVLAVDAAGNTTAGSTITPRTAAGTVTGFADSTPPSEVFGVSVTSP